MKYLRPWMRELAIFYFEWAEKEMTRCHPDAPSVTLRLCELRAERNQGGL